MRLLSVMLCLAFSWSAASEEHRFDAVVYGGTAGGAIAAIAAANEGLEVALVEPGRHIGGMISGGLGRTDYGNQAVIGGLSRMFFERVGKHYDEPISWFFEPHVAEAVLRAWLEEAGVRLFFGSPVDAVEKDDTRITAIKLSNGDRFVADFFVDASYESDVMARAGISYTWGREGSEVYGESLAGVREFSDKHQFANAVNPYDDDGQLLPLIQDLPLDAPGTGDKKVQAYNFRLCMTNVAENRRRFPKPEGYDPARWELLARYLQANPKLRVKDMMNPSMMPNGKTDTNNNGPLSTDYIGENWDYPEADYERRAAIWEEHKRYVQGFMYFLQNDPRVPELLREEMQDWGLAKDEFTDTDNWPHQLYVREARRMIGEYVMHQKDLQDERSKPDSIGMGSYNSDSHHVQRIVALAPGPWGEEVPRVLNEGDMQVPVQPYEMAYRSICPRAEEAVNLHVIGGFSASHVAYSSMRMEPQYMILGHAAGIALAQARATGVGVQEIDVAALQARLREQKSILSLDQAEAPFAKVSELPGIVIDNAGATTRGEWRRSSAITPYVGFDYLTEAEEGVPGNEVVFNATLPEPGCYELRLSYSPHNNRSGDVQIELRSGEFTKRLTLDQRKKLGAHSPFISLGEFQIPANTASITLRAGTPGEGYAVADAVQLLPVSGRCD